MSATAVRPSDHTSATAGRWRLRDLIHVLAQLPDDVSLDLRCAPDEAGHLELLSRAYALEDRTHLRASGNARTTWRFEGVPADVPAWATAGSTETPSPGTMAEMVEPLWAADAAPASTSRDDQLLSGHRLAIVTNLPTHYRVSLLNRLAPRMAAAGASLRVFFLGNTATARPWLTATEALDFDHEFLASARVPACLPFSSELDRHRPAHLARGLTRRLRAFDPSLLVSGGFSLATTEAYVHAARHRIPFGIWSGEIPSTAPRRSYPGIRAVQRRWLARQADFGIAYGSLAERYLSSLAPRLPIVIGRNTPVVEVSPEVRRHDRPTVELVTVADLSVPGKGIEVVTKALELVPDLPCRFTVIGGHPRNGSVLRVAAGDGRIDFLGPLPQQDVWAAYERSDVFVFPSRVDVFGLALVEAMSHGLAPIASRMPGAVADLAVAQHNCLIADASDPRSWANAISTLVEGADFRASAGRSAHTTIRRRWTIAHAVEAMIAGLRLGTLKAEHGKP